MQKYSILMASVAFLAVPAMAQAPASNNQVSSCSTLPYQGYIPNTTTSPGQGNAYGANSLQGCNGYFNSGQNGNPYSATPQGNTGQGQGRQLGQFQDYYNESPIPLAAGIPALLLIGGAACLARISRRRHAELG